MTYQHSLFLYRRILSAILLSFGGAAQCKVMCFVDGVERLRPHCEEGKRNVAYHHHTTDSECSAGRQTRHRLDANHAMRAKALSTSKGSAVEQLSAFQTSRMDPRGPKRCSLAAYLQAVNRIGATVWLLVEWCPSIYALHQYSDCASYLPVLTCVLPTPHCV